MDKPSSTDADRKLSDALAYACAQSSGCQASGDLAGQDAWLIAVNAIMLAVERANYAREVMDWSLVPEPKPVILAGQPVALNADGEVVPIRNASQVERAVGVAIDQPTEDGLVNIAVNDAQRHWQRVITLKVGKP
jgi:hypothetical protein